MNDGRRSLLKLLALPIGLALLAVTLARTDLSSLGRTTRDLGVALPVVLLPGAVWHLLRTLAWWRSFPPGAQPSFARAFRVRLAAEAFSFVTIRGVGGEPLKVALLAPAVAPEIAAAAVALERIAYLLVTALIVVAVAIAAVLLLPLTKTWIYVFGGVAVGSGAVLGGLGLLLARPRALPSALVASERPRRSRVAAFVRAVDAQLRDLVHTDGRRLSILMVLEALAYVAMGLEVLVALRAANAPISLPAAMAVEAFTRVASIVSAFIPANLGALEASNAAATGAVHAAAGAAGLVIVRRLRSLVWCIAGFAVFPRRSADHRERSAHSDTPADCLVVVEDHSMGGSTEDRVAGMRIGERQLRAAGRAGYARVFVWAPRHAASWGALAASTPGLVVSATGDSAAWNKLLSQLPPRVTAIPSSLLASPAWLRALRAQRCASYSLAREDLSAPESVARQLALAAPSCLDLGHGDDWTARLADRDDLAGAERRILASIYKPTDGIPARFNRRFSIPVSLALIRWTNVSANAMSILVILLGLYAGWLFSIGSYGAGVAAAVISLVASVLDGCDGELARLRYTDSAFGCWLDTFGDYSYYLAVFTGLTVGSIRQTGSIAFWWIGAALLAGSLLTFALLIVLRGRITDGQPERLRGKAQEHFAKGGKCWMRLVLSLSTCATRATMPYGILAFALAGALPVVVVLGAIGAHIYWISLALELRRLLAGTSVSSGSAGALHADATNLN